jgi:hypothetical protein
VLLNPFPLPFAQILWSHQYLFSVFSEFIDILAAFKTPILETTFLFLLQLVVSD